MLVKFLRENEDIFAWSSANMPGVPRELADHSLNVYKGAKPVKQGARRFDEKKRRAIGAEIVKLQEAKFIQEVVHTEWLTNPVLVPKPNKDLRMCIDYTGLKKCCPKDHFALSRIGQVVDSMAGSELLCFLDAYSGYH